MLKNSAFQGVADDEKRPLAGHNSPKISLYGIENCDYTAPRPTVFSPLPLVDWLKSPRVTGSNLIQLLAK
jgi:hypothetical protein